MQTDSDSVNASPATAAPQPPEGLRLVPGLRETLSALVDGEASEHEMDMVSAGLAKSPADQQAWTDYQWLGEALRAREQALPPASATFVSAVMERIHAEAAANERPVDVQAVPAKQVLVQPPEAANDAVFRWKMVAGVATLAAAAALVWQVAVAPNNGPQLAQAPSLLGEQVLVSDGTQAVMTNHGVVIRDPQLEALMAEHRQYGSMSALQMPAGFMRNATYESPQR